MTLRISWVRCAEILAPPIVRIPSPTGCPSVISVPVSVSHIGTWSSKWISAPLAPRLGGTMRRAVCGTLCTEPRCPIGCGRSIRGRPGARLRPRRQSAAAGPRILTVGGCEQTSCKNQEQRQEAEERSYHEASPERAVSQRENVCTDTSAKLGLDQAAG